METFKIKMPIRLRSRNVHLAYKVMGLDESYQGKSVCRQEMKPWAPLALRGAGDEEELSDL